MAPGDKSKDDRDEDDFDFESFLGEPGNKDKKGPPPPTEENKLPGNLEDEDDFASFLDDSGAREIPKRPDSGSIPIPEDEDDFASFLKDEEDKGTPVPFPKSEDSGTEVIDTSAIEGEDRGGDDFDFLGEEPTKAMAVHSATPAGEKEASPSSSDWNATGETEIIPVSSDEDDIVIGEDEGSGEEIDLPEEPGAPLPVKPKSADSKSRIGSILAYAGMLFVGLAGGYGATRLVVVAPLRQDLAEVEDARNKSAAAKGALMKQVQDADGKIDELSKERDDAVASANALKQEIDKLKLSSAEAQKAKADAVKQLQAAAASVADLRQAKEDLAKAQAELQTATDDAATAKEDKEQVEEKLRDLEAKVAELAAKPVPVSPSSDSKDSERVADLEKSLAAANEKIASLNQEIERFENQIEQGASDANPSAADKSVDQESAKALAALADQLRKSKSELASANQELDAAKQQLAAAQKQIAAAQSGGTSLYLMPAAGGDQPVSLRAYHQGLQDFYLGDNEAAVRALDNAIENYPRDARYFYYRALALRRLGENAKARDDAARGWALERQEFPTPYEVSQALERIQGGDRFWLAAQRSTKPADKVSH